EINEFQKLKEKNAIYYYSDYSITRETYDQLFQEYESKIAHLFKKQRILGRKFEKKKRGKNGEKNEVETKS
ncbi:MAG: hypothetical protein NT038_09155, partial [Euryarchaeota archaeon]|nr:hypothetical protein [Euryarchaeota archaeon]